MLCNLPRHPPLSPTGLCVLGVHSLLDKGMKGVAEWRGSTEGGGKENGLRGVTECGSSISHCPFLQNACSSPVDVTNLRWLLPLSPGQYGGPVPIVRLCCSVWGPHPTQRGLVPHGAIMGLLVRRGQVPAYLPSREYPSSALWEFVLEGLQHWSDVETGLRALSGFSHFHDLGPDIVTAASASEMACAGLSVCQL